MNQETCGSVGAISECDAPTDHEDFLNGLLGLDFQSHSPTLDESDLFPAPADEISLSDPPKRKTNKKENKMDSQEWKAAIDHAIQFIHSRNGPVCHRNRDITIKDFTTEPKQLNRFTVGKEIKRYCLMFPWFHLSGSHRFRQTLAAELRQGTTIDKVLESINYLLHLDFRQGNSLERLREYYEQMEVPISSHCLTAIVEVYSRMILEPHPARGDQKTFPTNFSSVDVAAGTFVPSVLTPESLVSSLEDVRSETSIEDCDPLHKRRRICTAHSAREKNREMIGFYEEILAAMPLNGPSSSRQIYQDIINNLQKANEDLLTDILFFEYEESQSQR
jgi:hypothetical protein